ncbi:MAG: tRNA (adenosine(37)-N6)-threonylcarbamoyltransferase complex ATPase subunit type 1 TsaE [Patescibacteria group bacterium]
MEILTKSARQTQKLGEKIANNLKERAIICLYGELGSGKTTFVQGVLKGLGIKKRVISPTFVMIREYRVQRKKGEGRRFYHVDLYRVESQRDAKGLGLEEILSNPANIVVIEWAEKIKKILPKERIDIYFQYLKEDSRKIRVVKMI